MKIQEAYADLRHTKQELESSMVPLRQELNRNKDMYAKERMARLSAQQETSMLKDQLLRLEKINEDLEREVKTIPALVDSNELLKTDLTRIRGRYKEEKTQLTTSNQMLSDQNRDLEASKAEIRQLAVRLLDLSSQSGGGGGGGGGQGQGQGQNQHHNHNHYQHHGQGVHNSASKNARHYNAIQMDQQYQGQGQGQGQGQNIANSQSLPQLQINQQHYQQGKQDQSSPSNSNSSQMMGSKQNSPTNQQQQQQQHNFQQQQQQQQQHNQGYQQQQQPQQQHAEPAVNNGRGMDHPTEPWIPHTLEEHMLGQSGGTGGGGGSVHSGVGSHAGSVHSHQAGMGHHNLQSPVPQGYYPQQNMQIHPSPDHSHDGSHQGQGQGGAMPQQSPARNIQQGHRD